METSQQFNIVISSEVSIANVIEKSQPYKRFLRFANAPVEMTKDNGRNDEWFIIVMSPSRSPKGLPARRDPDRIKKICIIDFAIIHIFYVA